MEENQRRCIDYSKPEVRQYFQVPKDIRLKQNENLAGFIVLLLQILDHESPSYVSDGREHLYGLLQKKLTFLHSFLGDTPFQFNDLEDIKNVLVEFESLANVAGSFIYSCVSASSEETRNVNFDAGIQGLFEKVEILNAKIKELRFDELQETVTLRSNPLRSPFIVESLLEDIEGLTNGLVGVTIDDVKVHIDKLMEELTFLKPSIKDVEMMKESLVHIIIDVAYEAEYLVNTYAVGHLPSWYLNLRLPVVVQKLVRTRLQVTNQIHDAKGTKTITNFPKGTSFQDNIDSKSAPESILIGFEDIMGKIFDDLTGGSSELQIVSIFGMSGSGKTTIANKLYEEQSNNGYFDLRVWCVVSQTYDTTKVLRDILRSLTGKLDNDGISKVDDMGILIHKHLYKRRYLIIFDNVWESSMWDDVRHYFPEDKNGSRILLTSQIKDIAPAHSIFLPPPLSESQCCKLLLKKIFINEHCPTTLLGIAEKIASKCHGLPLAVVVVAGILANLEMEVSAWENVERNLGSYISDDPINHILELSYEHLPNHLKLCFLYLGAFRQDEEILTGKLIPMWIAQGFLHKEEDKNIERIAEQYLFELINRSLLMIAKRRSDGGIKACRTHDLLHSMCLRRAGKEEFLKNIEVHSFGCSPIHQKYSHLALYSTLSNTCSISVPHCRSLLGFMSYLGYSVAQMPLLRAIRLLQLSKNQFNMRRICGLVHLRYLGLYGGAVLKEICKLVNLEYLHVDDSYTVHVPSAILKMVKLRHICITSEAVFDEICDMSQVTNNLKSLSRVFIRNHEEEKILKCSPHLQKLKCHCNALFPDLTSFTDLESLNIMISEIPLTGELTKMNFPSNLKMLTLSGTQLPWEETSVIGRLPNLSVLKLHDNAFVGEVWETRDDEFQELKFLKLYKLKTLREWTTREDHFPALEFMVLNKVSVQVPSDFDGIDTLHTIEVRNCGHEVCTGAFEIQEALRDNGNEDLKIIISCFHQEKNNQIDEDEEVKNIIDDVSQLEDEEKGKKIVDEVSHLEDDELLDKDAGSDFDKEELDRAIALSLSEEDKKGKTILDDVSQLEEGELLAEAPQDSLHLEESPPPRAHRHDHGSFFPPHPFSNRDCIICAGCFGEIGPGESAAWCMGSNWHPQCFRCYACNEPIIKEYTVSDKRPYHISCSMDPHLLMRCDVCKNLVPPNAEDGRVICSQHLFWPQNFCPSHRTDGTPLCFSCNRMEAIDGATYLRLDDGRKLCLECLEFSIMDTDECQSLYLEIRDFFEGLHMKLEHQFPIFSVESQALRVGRKGLLVYDQQGEVTAVHVLYGLPRLLTGKIIACLMMQAWLLVQGYQNFGPGVKKGICLVLSHMWLEPEIVASSSKKGVRSEFEKKLGEWFKYQTELHLSATNRDGFRAGMKAVEKYGLRKTLDHIKRTGAFPDSMLTLERRALICYVCKYPVPPSADDGRIKYLQHPFWLHKLCLSHATDGTPECFSCRRMEVVDLKHLILDNGRQLCLECLESSIMDTDDCQSLYIEIQEFFEGLNMKVEQQFPLILAESQALNEVTPGNDVITTGICLFDEQNQGVTTPNFSPEPGGLVRGREVTAILVLYGLPRLKTGCIIAYEMMKAWLGIQGYRNLGPGVEEGICHVISHMWLDAEIVAGSSKKGERSEFEKKLGEYFKHRIESDTSATYGDGFRAGIKAVEKYGLRKTLDEIRSNRTFPR